MTYNAVNYYMNNNFPVQDGQDCFTLKVPFGQHG